MAISFDINDYPEPDTEWEDYEENIQAKLARKGDRLDDGSPVFGRISNGHKYTRIFGLDEQQLLRVELDTIITVTRRRETEESRERTGRYDKIRRICRTLRDLDLDSDLESVLERLNGDAKQYHYADYGVVGMLISAQAERRVWAQFQQAAEWASKAEAATGDPVDFLDEYLDDLRNQLCAPHNHRSISRSTNVLSNLMDDAQLEQIAKFIDHTRWW